MTCPAADAPRWYRDKDILQAEIAIHGGRREAALAHGVKPNTVNKAANDLGFAPELPGPKPRVLKLIQGGMSDALNDLVEHAAKPKPVKPGARQSSRGLERLFFLSDAHIPFHDKAGLSIWLRALADFKPTTVVSLGDFVDCFSVSTYSKDPRRVLGLRGEMEEAEAVLDQIERAAPKARRIYIAGNHEDRLQRYLQDKAPAVFDYVDIPRLLHLDERGWEYVPYKQSTRIGKLHLTHDVGSAGRYNAFRALEAFQAPVVTGHTHRMSYVVEGDATGGTQVSAQFGWLGDVTQVDYMHRIQAMKNWTLGFGYGYVDPDSGYCYLIPVPIVNGTAVVEGRLYSAEPAEAAA